MNNAYSDTTQENHALVIHLSYSPKSFIPVRQKWFSFCVQS